MIRKGIMLRLGLVAWFVMLSAGFYGVEGAERADPLLQEVSPQSEEEILIPLAELRARDRLSKGYEDDDLLARPKARRLHDRVTVVINEKTLAKHEAKTDLKGESKTNWALAKFFMSQIDKDGKLYQGTSPMTPGDTKGSKPESPNIKIPNVDLSSSQEHKGEGTTERNSSFQAEISGEVMEILPNGHLVVEARKTILINAERQTLTFTGRIDPKDLDADNRVEHRFVIDPSIKLTGEGEVSDTRKRGLVTRVLQKVKFF